MSASNEASKLCKFCGKEFQHGSSLSRHIKRQHSEEQENGSILCNEEKCQCRFVTLKDLIYHLKSVHNKCIAIEEKSFDDLHSFLSWKDDEEKKGNSSYVQQCGVQTSVSSSVKRYYYYCHRSGRYSGKGSGIRELKVQGSCKVGFTCTAYLKATEDLTTKLVHVEYCFFHYNHTTQLAHLKMPEDLRKDIALKLQEGVSEKKILDNIRNKVHGDIGREHLVTLQDIQNIRRQYNIEGIQRHKSDHQSVKIWVEEMATQNYNPVLLHKFQGEESCIEMNNLTNEDLLLGVQTEFQKDMMIKFGNNIICLDATHGTTMYDFLLISVMVIDEYGEGIPVAWALSNKEDKIVLIHFLNSLKLKVGNLTPKIVMSDCAEQYYAAWIEVFEGVPKRLLCTWHVDKAWRRKLNESVNNKENRINIYHHLRTLLEEKSISKFNVLLQQFLAYLQEENKEFQTYFQKEYASRVQEWAYAYRIGAEINTNMYVESFHRVLKIVYLDSKQNRRVDHLLAVLLRFARDKAFERIQKLEKGKSSHRIKEINKRHTSAKEMMSSGIFPIQQSESSWKVASQTNTDQHYIVVQLNEECSCLLRCSNCHACVHMFSCSCADAHLHNTVCKHVHIVQITLTGSSTDPTHSDWQVEDVSPSVINSFTEEDQDLYEDLVFLANDDSTEESRPDSTEYFARVLQSSDSTTDLSEKKSLLRKKVNELLVLLDDANNPDSIATATQHVTTGIHSLKAMTSPQADKTDFPINKRPASNANHEKQTRFFSTKKKKVSSKRWAKPTQDEKIACHKTLEDVQVIHCGNCLKEDDNDTSDTVEWVQCSACGIWLHKTCVDLISTDFVCNNCVIVQ